MCCSVIFKCQLMTETIFYGKGKKKDIFFSAAPDGKSIISDEKNVFHNQ